MKHLLILITLLTALATSSVAQITTTLSEGSYYYVVVQGDTISQHNRLDKAIESASNATMMGGDWDIVQNYRLRGSSYFYDETIIIEEIIDTVFVPTDTVVVHTTRDPDHIIMLQNIDFDFDVESTGQERIDFTITTQPDETDTLYTEIRCEGEWVENNIFVRPAETLQYGILWDCSSRLTYQFRAVNDEGWEETVTNSYPLWMSGYNRTPEGKYLTTFENTATLESDWVNTWGTLDYSVDNATLIVDLPSRSIARLQWNSVPEHRNIEYQVRETLHASHSTGAHIGGRHSESDSLKNSVETYIHSEGLGVSVFNNGSWSNPHSFPFEWTSGDTVEYKVRIIDDTISTKIWNINNTEPEQWSSFSSPIIGSTSSGYFAIGSTGAGLYIIHEVEVTILD